MQILKRLYRGITVAVADELRPTLEWELFRSSQRMAKIIYIIILTSQTIMMLSMAVRKGGPFASMRRSGYFLLYLCLFLLTVCYMLLDIWVRRDEQRRYRSFMRAQALYAAVLCIWGCGITLLDQLGGNGLTVFIYVTLMAAILITLRPWQSILIFGGELILLNCLLPYFPQPAGGDQTFNNFINSFFITTLAVVIASVFYNNRVTACQDAIVIERQYSEIKKMNEELRGQIMADSLTGLHNRIYLNETIVDRLQVARALGQSVACLMVDIDFFKSFNDRYGHQAGDACLKGVAEVLLEHCAGEGEEAVRYGGEEFAVFLFGCSTAAAMEKAQAFCRSVKAQQYTRDDVPAGCVTVSVGVCARKTRADENIDSLIRDADRALYEAKDAGRDCVRLFDADGQGYGRA